MTPPNEVTEQVPVSSDWGQMFFNTVGFYPPRGEVAAGAPPAEAQPTANGQDQTPTGGQGGSKDQTGGFNWDLFPDVPEDQRPLVEPHLRNVQGHVTRMEQQMAPLRPLFDQGLNPDSVAALGSFAIGFEQNPVQAWHDLAQQMQQHGMIDESLDLDNVLAIATGKDTDEGAPEGTTPGAGQAEGANPELAAALQRIEQLENQNTTRDATERQQQESQMLDGALGEMRTALEEAKVPVPDEKLLAASIVTHGGDHNAAVQSLLGFRNEGLKAVATQDPSTEDSELDMPRGAPESRERKGGSRDGFRAARDGASQMLKSRRRAAASE